VGKVGAIGAVVEERHGSWRRMTKKYGKRKELWTKLSSGGELSLGEEGRVAKHALECGKNREFGGKNNKNRTSYPQSMRSTARLTFGGR